MGKPLIICLHGYLDNAASFLPLFPHFTDYHVIAIDLAGHGKSDHRAGQSLYHLTDYVYELYEFIHHQGFKDIVLMGHSFGAILSSIFTATYPELIKHFVSIEAIGPLSQPAETSVEQLRNSFTSRYRLLESEHQQPKDFESLVEHRHRATGLSKENASGILQRNTKVENGKLLWSSDRALRTKSSLRFTPEQAQNILHNIGCPTTVILGSEGHKEYKEHIDKLPIKNIFCAEAKGGHHVHMDSPESVSHIILRRLT